MEALTNLIINIPDWQQKLDELNGKIAQRQIELAQLTENQTSTSSGRDGSPPKSIRNKGSTESLKPPGEPAAHPREITPQPEATQPAAIITSQAEENRRPQKGAPSSPAESQSPSAIQRQTNQMKAAGQARARATLRKRQRTDSVVSAENQPPKYRTRSMIIVYYDSYVQSFFEELVKFVSASRNMMRKAKMAAKVAQIKRLAEMEAPDDSEEDEDEDADAAAATAALVAQSTSHAPLAASASSSAPLAVDKNIQASTGAEGEEEITALGYTSTRAGRMPPSMARTQNLLTQISARPGMYTRAGVPRSYARPGGTRGGTADPPDIYDELDKGLEYVQSMCEHAAHQFLRDGDCAEEVANIQRRMGETKELADKEMERVKREEPEVLKAAEETFRVRSYRPQSMRKVGSGLGGGAMAALVAAKESASRAAPGPAPAAPAANGANGVNGAADSGASNGGHELPAISAAANGNAIEVDEGVEDMDYYKIIPKLTYKSTRRMMG